VTALLDDDPAPSSAGTERTSSAAGAVRGLLTWYRPYLAGHRRQLGWVTLGSLVVLACQALIPWVVEVLLHHGHWDTALLGLLLGLVVLLLVVSYVTHLGTHAVANESSLVLSTRVFERTLRSRVLRQEGLLRSSIVMRLTADVDRVSGAVESTLASGFPGVGRLVISLVLLTVIEWKAGVAMTLASIGFILVRRRIGRRMLVVDRDRLQSLSRLGENVDEAIANARTLGGLNLIGWQVARFTRLAEAVEHRTHQQGVVVSRLILAAHAAAFTGLVVVVVFALALGGEDLASVAAALLYVEGAVRGLEALPPWIRDVQLAAASQHRLDHVLNLPDRIVLPPDAPGPTPGAPAGLALEGVTARLSTGVSLTAASALLPPGTVVGLVTRAGTEPDEVLELLSGDVNPDEGRVTLDGADVRTPELARQLFYVPDEAEALSASLMELLRAVAPDITASRAAELATTVSLDHIVSLPHGVEERLGPGGAELTVSERQRLMLAVALAAEPRVLLVGSLLALADVDSALPLIGVLRAGAQESTVISVRSGEIAEAVDLILFVSGGSATVGTHQQLLVDVPEYAQLWQQRLSTTDVDLSVVGIDKADEDRMLSRLVTEHYSPGDLIYRQGSPADRILFVISGHVEITTTTASGRSQRVAVLGPGNHCGDLRLTAGEVRAENALALDDCVVRSLSRQAITAGLTGLLDRSAVERRLIESLLRDGPATRLALQDRLADVDDASFASSIALLAHDGAIRDDDGVLSAVLKRSAKTGARDLLDRLGDL
jgi:ABC-type multidrug transport system fused ATPase/permease subunit